MENGNMAVGRSFYKYDCFAYLYFLNFLEFQIQVLGSLANGQIDRSTDVLDYKWIDRYTNR